jgi:hypothetical protein
VCASFVLATVIPIAHRNSEGSVSNTYGIYKGELYSSPKTFEDTRANQQLQKQTVDKDEIE